MKRSDKTTPQTPEQLIAQSRNPSPEQVEFRMNRVWERVQSAIDDRPVETPEVFGRTYHFQWLALLAAAVVALSLISVAVLRHASQPARTALEYGQVITSENMSK